MYYLYVQAFRIVLITRNDTAHAHDVGRGSPEI